MRLSWCILLVVALVALPAPTHATLFGITKKAAQQIDESQSLLLARFKKPSLLERFKFL
ncbi:hypothetical protein ACQY0O_008137 [Thecaphora frezii]